MVSQALPTSFKKETSYSVRIRNTYSLRNKWQVLQAALTSQVSSIQMLEALVFK